MDNIWIVNGIPGAGKSTTARTLARCFARAVHIEGDLLQACILKGAVSPGEQPTDEEQRQIHLNVRNQCLLAHSFAREGFTPIIDYVVVNRARIDEYRSQLSGYTLRLVTLAPWVNVALERDRNRPEKTVAAQWAYLDGVLRAELAGVGLWVDNSELTVDQTVDVIMTQQVAAIV